MEETKNILDGCQCRYEGHCPLFFGGPVAHIAYFRDNFVLKKKWFDEKTYLDIVSFSNFLPGPSSSQVGMCIGYLKNGILGSFFAWLGFTLPSAVIMILFAFGYSYFDEYISLGFLNGIKAVVIIIVLRFNIYKQENYWYEQTTLK